VSIGPDPVRRVDDPRDDPDGRRRRPWIERIGLAGIALVFAALFAAIALGSWSGGELFLAVMGGIGCFMTLWVGALTLVRG
jgi:hypothetical protein